MTSQPGIVLCALLEYIIKATGEHTTAAAPRKDLPRARKHPGLFSFFGVHHVHHLGPRIPNYALKRCHEENPLFHDVTTLTLAQSIRTLRLTLWDETRHQLVGFRDAIDARPAKAA